MIGNVREPGEGEILAAWHGAGLPCARPLTWGYVQVRAASTGAPATSTASYVVTALVAGRKLPRPRDFDDCVGQALELVDLIRPFHLADVRVSRARPWSDRLAPHLNEILPLLETHGLPEPDRWRAKLDRLSRTGRVLVHGDPAGSNVLRTDRGLVLLDPPGAVVALPEADVAQICCQVARADGVGELIPLVAERHPRLDPSAVAGFAGLNLLVWAGYVVAEHANPDVARAGASASGSVPPPAGRDAGIEKAERYLHTARTLLDQYPPA